MRCGNCEFEPIDHNFKFVHHNKSVCLSFIRRTSNIDGLLLKDIKTTITCKYCQCVFESHSFAQIPFELFLHNLVYSTKIFPCLSCQGNGRHAKNSFGDFSFGFHIWSILCLFRVENIDVFEINSQNLTFKNNDTAKIITKFDEMVKSLEKSKKRSIDFILSHYKTSAEKVKDPKQLSEHQGFANDLNLISQNCNEKFVEIDSLIKEFAKDPKNKDWAEINNRILQFTSYLYVNFNFIFMKLKEKKLSKFLNIDRDYEFSKFRIISKILMDKTAPFDEYIGFISSITNKKQEKLNIDCPIKASESEDDLLAQTSEKVLSAQSICDPLEICSDSQPLRTSRDQDKNEKNEEMEQEITKPHTMDQAANLEIPAIQVPKSEDLGKKIKIDDILPFPKDLHVVTCNDNVFTFVDSLPASIISIFIRMPEIDQTPASDTGIKTKTGETTTTLDTQDNVSPDNLSVSCLNLINTSEQFSIDVYDENMALLSPKYSGCKSSDTRCLYSISSIELAQQQQIVKTLHFHENEYKYSCSIYRHKSFEKLRKLAYGFSSNNDYADILSESELWNAQGGKSDSTFYKTKDDFCVVKQISQIEARCFEEFMDNYLDFMIESLENKMKTSLCIILGLYKITISMGSSIKSQNYYIIMENIFFQFKMDHMYDIKGCIRKNIKAFEGNIFEDSQILQNLCKDPIFIHHKPLADLHITLRRDTRFLEENSVVDFSLIVGVNKQTMELKMGIVDYLRKYTWDKRLESVVKSKILIATSAGRLPTIVSPTEYRMRFIDAIKLYFFPVSRKWDYLEIMKIRSKSDIYFINSYETEKYHASQYNEPIMIKHTIM
ncbi:1-phosphatidylinositol 3-phosphate 5-kinase [Thelohanellus kitauei]|uniref:1-phosphatidylinositol 3-phosphate 5-kinase n=1 Tax=Thelohanellus kitauei TaxID=669202 RepID=A0A0C2MPC7_THEKT|nr:1-phosphatidylinositol 3-phosphate 5-kinase [Thelohanellus kitauei]